MPKASESLAASEAAQPKRTSVQPKVLATVSPPRQQIKEAYMQHYHALLDYALTLSEMLGTQEDMLPKRQRRALNPKRTTDRIREIGRAADRCLEIATLIPRVDAETLKWCLPEIPPMPGKDLLPHQDLQFLAGLGTYHRLYVGAYKKKYGRRR